jgi:hypothetical protein
MISDGDDVNISTSGNKENVSTAIGDIDEITEEELKSMKEEFGVAYKPIIKSLSKQDNKKLIDRLGVEVAEKYDINPKDTILSNKKQQKENKKSETVKAIEFDDDFLSESKFNWDLFNDELKENKDISDQQVYDSIYIGKASSFEQLVARQRIKVERTEMEYFAGYALKNLPLMMFLMLPIFALLLKLLYIRRNVLYIKHLIHALHLHAFAYLFYGLTLLITFYFIDDQDVSDSNALGDWVNLFSFVLVSTYAYISFMKVYKQHWFKTLIKFNIHGLLYASLLMLFFAVEMAISFLMF